VPVEGELAAAHRPIPYRPDLDGLRAIAILLVMVTHTGLPTQAAAAGVTAFFVLSGYLITSILLSEERVDLRDFYRRRLRRLAPAFLVMLAITGTFGLLGWYGAHWLPDRFLASVFYVTNWFVQFGPPSGPTDHVWSLAIEEQFYLSWPLLVALLSRRKLVLVAAVGIVIGLWVRSASGDAFGYFATQARMDGPLLGCLLALTGVRLPRSVGLAGLALLGIAALSSARLADLTTLATVAGGMIVASRTPLGALAPLGKRAYSLYLWNSPMVLLTGAIGTSLTFIVGELSYRLIECPLRERLAKREASTPDVAQQPAASAAPSPDIGPGSAGLRWRNAGP
jgi:peptidoglycan/LPS O-acetylase OafA/YrhL